MDNNTKVSYEFVNGLLEKYYKEKYPEYDIKCKSNNQIHCDSDGWDYYTFDVDIYLTRKAVIMDNSIVLTSSISLSDKETKSILKDIFKQELEKKYEGEFEVTSVSPEEKCVYFSVKINEKRLIK